MVERGPEKAGVDGSTPPLGTILADVAQLVEQGFRKAQVGGSIPLIGSKFREAGFGTDAM